MNFFGGSGVGTAKVLVSSKLSPTSGPEVPCSGGVAITCGIARARAASPRVDCVGGRNPLSLSRSRRGTPTCAEPPGEIASRPLA